MSESLGPPNETRYRTVRFRLKADFPGQPAKGGTMIDPDLPTLEQARAALARIYGERLAEVAPGTAMQPVTGTAGHHA